MEIHSKIYFSNATVESLTCRKRYGNIGYAKFLFFFAYIAHTGLDDIRRGVKHMENNLATAPCRSPVVSIRSPDDNENQAIYSVTFHTKPKRRVHSFWFLDREKASRFYESVKKHPSVLDYRMYRTPVTDAEEYDGLMEEAPILPVEI